MQQKIPPAAARLHGFCILFDGFRVERRGIGVNSRAGLDDFNDYQTDQQRERRHYFKINQSLDADAPQFFQIADSGNSADNRQKNNRRDDHLDEFDKRIAERF